jgi:hypothetical protein
MRVFFVPPEKQRAKSIRGGKGFLHFFMDSFRTFVKNSSIPGFRRNIEV